MAERRPRTYPPGASREGAMGDSMRVMVSPLLERMGTREARAGIVGLGYLGLPLGMAFAEAGFPVMGFDIDRRKVDKVGQGESYIKHIGSEPLKKLADSGKLKATTDFA